MRVEMSTCPHRAELLAEYKMSKKTKPNCVVSSTPMTSKQLQHNLDIVPFKDPVISPIPLVKLSVSTKAQKKCYGGIQVANDDEDLHSSSGEDLLDIVKKRANKEKGEQGGIETEKQESKEKASKESKMNKQEGKQQNEGKLKQAEKESDASTKMSNDVDKRPVISEDKDSSSDGEFFNIDPKQRKPQEEERADQESSFFTNEGTTVANQRKGKDDTDLSSDDDLLELDILREKLLTTKKSKRSTGLEINQNQPTSGKHESATTESSEKTKSPIQISKPSKPASNVIASAFSSQFTAKVDRVLMAPKVVALEEEEAVETFVSETKVWGKCPGPLTAKPAGGTSQKEVTVKSKASSTSIKNKAQQQPTREPVVTQTEDVEKDAKLKKTESKLQVVVEEESVPDLDHSTNDKGCEPSKPLSKHSMKRKFFENKKMNDTNMQDGPIRVKYPPAKKRKSLPILDSATSVNSGTIKTEEIDQDQIDIRRSSRSKPGPIRFWEQRLNYHYENGLCTLDTEAPVKTDPIIEAIKESRKEGEPQNKKQNTAYNPKSKLLEKSGTNLEESRKSQKKEERQSKKQNLTTSRRKSKLPTLQKPVDKKEKPENEQTEDMANFQEQCPAAPPGKPSQRTTGPRQIPKNIKVKLKLRPSSAHSQEAVPKTEGSENWKKQFNEMSTELFTNNPDAVCEGIVKLKPGMNRKLISCHQVFYSTLKGSSRITLDGVACYKSETFASPGQKVEIFNASETEECVLYFIETD
ncbi:transcriptional regulator ATRX-like isoform X4 [Neocloeon triangulifer]|uniref:transcriptional regulator ATRX-like isoform X4 n=1 Tax=Neocloeon triangulifer TaxID=2078957 RepID=UPI00286F0D61|nr:transcriptional regulator ATRX-like isoform X4 [Neocloeon triangulifer]